MLLAIIGIRIIIFMSAGILLQSSNKVDLWPFLSIGLMGLVTAAITIVFTIITFILVRTKSKVQEELKRYKVSALYDEIGTPPSVIDSSKNIAYISAIKDDKSM